VVDAQGIRGLVEREGGSMSTARAEVRTSLASAGGDGSPGWGDVGGSSGVKSDKKLWSTAGHGVSSLQGNVKKAQGQLDEKQPGLGPGCQAVNNLETGTEQHRVYRSWTRYLDLVRSEASELAGKLEKAGDDHYKNDQAVADAFRAQHTVPEETAPSSGRHPSQGR
jgi:hypothetical protein